MKKQLAKTSSLQRALDFLAIASSAKDQGLFAQMETGQARVFNRIIGAGTPIEEDLACCPQIDLFRTALARCGENFVITQLSRQKLLVRSEDFHAYIPCLEADSLSWCSPDAAMGILDDRFMDALGKVAGLAATTAERVIECSIQLNNGSVIATNGSTIMEAWHGVNFPNGLLMPKSSYNALRKAKRKLVSFGFSDNSITFYFEDASWFFTKLFKDKWPDVQKHLSVPVQLHDVPSDFFVAVKKVLPFSGDGHIYVEGHNISSHPPGTKEEGSGLTLQFEGVAHAARWYSGNDLKFISPHALKWDEDARKDGTYFVGDNLRGLIFHGRQAGTDDDIPF